MPAAAARWRCNSPVTRHPWPTGTGGQPDLANSLYIEAPISIMGFSISVSPEEVITASLNFSLSGQPTKLFV